MKSRIKTEKYLIEDNLSQVTSIAKKMFLDGKLFVYPTDTIYGFGANPFNFEAVQRVNKIKNRIGDKNYILLIGDIQTLLDYVEAMKDTHLRFISSIWPNPISVVLKLNKTTKEKLGSETAAFRIPNNDFCLMLLNSLGMPLVSTSVNRSNELPLNDPGIIAENFSGEIDALFYTNEKISGFASTLIDLTGEEPVLLREGKIKFNDIKNNFELNK
ncbi:MAG TPA: L-threonylcarbamoyladenylate synthase [Ignavibacteriaceae bacterium]|nr:L-threonylcarbamoyladenylate synthase [Ignavibacteriaceae bacterium]